MACADASYRSASRMASDTGTTGSLDACTYSRAPFTILPLLTSKRVKPLVERAYNLDEAAEALRHLIEDRPFGRVVLAQGVNGASREKRNA